MASRLIIDGNSVYEIDEDCERCGCEMSVRAQGRRRACRMRRQEKGGSGGAPCREPKKDPEAKRSGGRKSTPGKNSGL